MNSRPEVASYAELALNALGDPLHIRGTEWAHLTEAATRVTASLKADRHRLEFNDNSVLVRVGDAVSFGYARVKCFCTADEGHSRRCEDRAEAGA